MRICALRNAEGLILAAVAVDGQYNGPIPVASEGAKVGMFDAPASPSELRLDEIATNFRVDVGSQRLVEARDAYGVAQRLKRSTK
jgi:hypothetical protein